MHHGHQSWSWNFKIPQNRPLLPHCIVHVVGAALYYKRGPGEETNFKVVSGADEANVIFNDFHASPTGGHCGQIKKKKQAWDVDWHR